jgi:hypothetical protein
MLFKKTNVKPAFEICTYFWTTVGTMYVGIVF